MICHPFNRMWSQVQLCNPANWIVDDRLKNEIKENTIYVHVVYGGRVTGFNEE